MPLSRLIHGSGGTRPPTPNGADIRGQPSPNRILVLKANQSLQSYPRRAYARRPGGKRRGIRLCPFRNRGRPPSPGAARAFLHVSRSARGRLFGHNPKHTTDFRTEIVAEEDDFSTLRMTVSSSILQKAQPAQQGFQLIRVTLDVFMTWLFLHESYLRKTMIRF